MRERLFGGGRVREIPSNGCSFFNDCESLSEKGGYGSVETCEENGMQLHWKRLEEHPS